MVKKEVGVFVQATAQMEDEEEVLVGFSIFLLVLFFFNLCN